MTDELSYDVFLSCDSRDADVVRPIAERLQTDGLRVWFYEWSIQPGEHFPTAIRTGIERSRHVACFLSARSKESDWVAHEIASVTATDPLNKSGRLLPVRLDDTEPAPDLRQLQSIDWFRDGHDAYAALLDACRRSPGSAPSRRPSLPSATTASSIRLGLRSGNAEESFESRQRLTTLGRSPASTIRVSDPAVSWEHAQIILMSDGYHYRQISTRSAAVLRRRGEEWLVGPGGRSEVVLQNGDRLTVGNTTFVVELNLVAADAGSGYVTTELTPEENG